MQAVDDAMLDRALNAQPFAESRNSGARIWQLVLDERDAREVIRAALTAALNGSAPPAGEGDELEWALNYGGELADWCNVVRPALANLMAAYERRVRSDCKTDPDLEARPWRCAEFVQAEEALCAQPVIVVDVPRRANTGQEGGRVVGSRNINGVHVIVAKPFSDILPEQLLVRYDDYLAAAAGSAQAPSAEEPQASNEWTCKCGTVNPKFDPWCSACEEPQS